MTRVTVRVEGLEIGYRSYRRARGARARGAVTIPAIRGIDFEVHRGEAVALVGRNGAGKSTLLRTIAGISAPTAGRVLVEDQPVLLGVNSTLLPRLSGWQNIELGLLALGLSLDEVAEYTPRVGEFTDLGDALDRPLKTYSSGMKSRVGFAIATIKRPTILLLDEALAVGDINFKRRSIRRLRTITNNAATLIMASHNSNEVRRTCSRVVWLEHGQIVADGEVNEVMDAFESALDGDPNDP